MSNLTKQYRLRYKASTNWTSWYPHRVGQSFNLDLDTYDMAEWRDTPKPCDAKAPFEIEDVGRPTCERLDDTYCRETGSHMFDLEISTDDGWNDCYHTREITWSALDG